MFCYMGSMTLGTNQQCPQASARPRVQDSGALSSEVKNPQPTLQQEPHDARQVPCLRCAARSLRHPALCAVCLLSCARRTTDTTSKCPAYTTNPKLGSTAPCASEACSYAASSNAAMDSATAFITMHSMRCIASQPVHAEFTLALNLSAHGYISNRGRTAPTGKPAIFCKAYSTARRGTPRLRKCRRTISLSAPRAQGVRWHTTRPLTSRRSA